MQSLLEILGRGALMSATLRLSRSFKVYEDHDKTEGRGGQTLRYEVATRPDADALAVGLGVWGQPGRIDEATVITIDVAGRRFTVPANSVTDAVEDNKAALRAAVMLRLTPAERAALAG
jgi:hypothetical protein